MSDRQSGQAKPRAGLLGGSFDPVHVAHIALAKAAYQALALDHIELIPAANPWQRKPLAASSAHRLNMLKLATHATPFIRVNPVEIHRGGKTYTLDTLNQLPDTTDYVWILGTDQLENFCSWHGWRDIIRRVDLAVAQRPGSVLTPPAALALELQALGRTLNTIPLAPMAVSATDIRRRLANNETTNGLLDIAVARYIHDNKLYRN